MSSLRALATYRLQLHRDFGFRHAESVTSYLSELGITHCYSSSLLAAMPGSIHGYDIIDPLFRRTIRNSAGYHLHLKRRS